MDNSIITTMGTIFSVDTKGIWVKLGISLQSHIEFTEGEVIDKIYPEFSNSPEVEDCQRQLIIEAMGWQDKYYARRRHGWGMMVKLHPSFEDAIRYPNANDILFPPLTPEDLKELIGKSLSIQLQLTDPIKKTFRYKFTSTINEG